MSYNEAIEQLEAAKATIAELTKEIESLKAEKENVKKQEFINSLKHSSFRHGF